MGCASAYQKYDATLALSRPCARVITLNLCFASVPNTTVHSLFNVSRGEPVLAIAVALSLVVLPQSGRTCPLRHCERTGVDRSATALPRSRRAKLCLIRNCLANHSAKGSCPPPP